MIKIQVNTTQQLNVDEFGLSEDTHDWGSGFYISEDGMILTAAHVIKRRSPLNREPITCYDPNTKRSFGPIIVYENEDLDIALLQDPLYTLDPDKKCKYIRINAKGNRVRNGDLCYCIGFPAEMNEYNRIFGLSSGYITKSTTNLPGHLKVNWRKNVLTCNCEATTGFSGGILIGSNFEPIGVILAIEEYKGEQTSCIVRRINEINENINEHLK
ncbi:serine protease [Candidatus Neomarinimicrobiota bacterium]